MSDQGNRQGEKDWRDSEPLDDKKYKNFYQLAGGVFITVVILLVGGGIYSNPNSGYWVNIYATAVGTILTIAVLDRQAEIRMKRERTEEAKIAEERAIRQRKEELILQMGSPNNGFAVEAVRLLEKQKWLRDGSLIRADLHKADLLRANLQRSILPGANLQETYLNGANLYGADLAGANLRKANLKLANLECTWLNGANLEEAQFDINTILSDGSNWTPDRDMREFTHPDEWKAEQAAKQSIKAP